MAMVEEKLGHFEKAQDLYEKCLDIAKKTIGEEHPNVALTEMNIGNLLRQQGDHENALFHLQKALDIQTRCLGTGHVAVANTKNNMAIVYGNLGNQTKRLQLNREAHEIFMQALGPDHPTTKGITPFI